MGLEVVSGVVDFYVTYGLPLPDILQSLKEQNRVPCWVSFIEEGKKVRLEHENMRQPGSREYNRCSWEELLAGNGSDVPESGDEIV